MTDSPDKQMAAALGRVPSGLYVLTLSRGDIETGMLASWVQQCSFQPPQLTVALQRGREIGQLLTPGSTLTLNILEESQTDMIAHFGRGFGLGDQAFADLDIQRGGTGGPILTEALAYVDGRVADRFAAGDHDIFVVTLTAGRMLGDGQPMVHVRKNGLHY